MPLHLLGKKSWNVYNPANIARVRRDEEAARAQEEAEEQRMQEADAARRLAILRGEIPPPLEEPDSDRALALPPTLDSSARPRPERKRKRHGEDDTDFEMRLARERASANDRAVRNLTTDPPIASTSTPTSLVDSKGHITLFSEPERPHQKNEEATQEAARKERELKDQYQMRLVNAAGKDGLGLSDGGPWYASADGEAAGAMVPSKNVWGREDPERKVREAKRLDASDPLAMMKRGAKMVRELGKERRKEVEEREREIRALEREERREERRRERRKRREDEERDRRGEEGTRDRRRREDGGGKRRDEEREPRRERRMDEGEGSLGPERSRYRDVGEEYASDEREGQFSEKTTRPSRSERARRGEEERRRDVSQDRSRRRNERSRSPRHGDDSRHHRTRRSDHDRDRHRHSRDQR